MGARGRGRRRARGSWRRASRPRASPVRRAWGLGGQARGASSHQARSVSATLQAWAMQPPGANGGVAVEDLRDGAEPVVGQVMRHRLEERARGRAVAVHAEVGERRMGRAASPTPCPGGRRRRARAGRRRSARCTRARRAPGCAARTRSAGGARRRPPRVAAAPARAGSRAATTAKIWFGRSAGSSPSGPSITS